MSQIFRQASLERLSSPEKLDQLMQVVTLRAWAPLATLGVLTAGIVAWSVFGRVAVTVQARGAFVDPGVAYGAHSHVVDLQAPGTGTLLTLSLKRGEIVHKGELLGTIDQPALRSQIEAERAHLDELTANRKALTPVTHAKSSVTQAALKRQRGTIAQALDSARALAPELATKTLAAIAAQRRDLEKTLRETRPLVAGLKSSLESRRELRRQGLITDTASLNAERDYLGMVQQVSGVETALKDLEAREAEARRAAQANREQIATLENQLRQIDVQLKALDLDDLQGTTTRETAIKAVKRHLAHLEDLYHQHSEIRAVATGTVLEVAGVVGHTVAEGTRLGALDLDTSHREHDALISVGYFTIGDGKRIRPGMKVQVTPDSVKREEYGGVIGTVRAVSTYPVTVDGALNVVNSRDTAAALTANGHTIEVFMTLEAAETPSGFRWSGSRGPELALSAGLTNAVRVTVEERAPITFVLPLLRGMLGLH